MKKVKEWKVVTKIMFCVLMCVVLIIVSTGIQFAVNMGVQKIPDRPLSSDKTNYDQGGLAQLLFDYTFARENNLEIDAKLLGEDYVAKQIDGSINYINNRFDCADFTANAVIRFYLENEDILSEKNKKTIKDCLLNFKYWMTQGGQDSMCFWSENHQILFAVTEFLVAQTFPNDIFSVDGKTASEHKQMAMSRINSWTEQRFKYGFNEYYSNNYYPEDIAPMSNFLLFADKTDPTIAVMADKITMAMDLLWFDIASQSNKIVEDDITYYTYMSASGRTYFDNKASDDTGNRLRIYTDFILGNDSNTKVIKIGEKDVVVPYYEMTTDRFFGSFSRMVKNGDYVLPEVIKEVFNDPSKKQIVKSSSGMDVSELEAHGLLGQNDNQIMMQLGMEAFSNPEIIDNTIKYLAKNDMFSNFFVNDFKLVNLWPLRLTNTLGEVSKLLNPSTNGVAIERGNVYTYQTPQYSMSTSQAHHAFGFGDQQQISISNLSKDLSVFTVNPMRESSREGYWVGQGRFPYSCQEENVNLSIFKLPTKVAMLEPHIVKFTHTYFPVGLFDEIDESRLDDGMIFGRKGDAYIAIRASEKLAFKEYNEADANKIKSNVNDILKTLSDKRYDLICEGGLAQAYATELSSAENESFADFKTRIMQNEFGFDEKLLTMKYSSNGKSFESVFDESFKVDRAVVDFNYKRFDSVYSTCEREAEEIKFSFNGKSLTLNYKNNTRTIA